ncbi:MAG: hypothetical protein ABIG31_06115 [Candidatus Omnitrophota bacterium]
MAEGVNQVFILSLIALLLIWLIYRIRRGVKGLIEKEIYKNFPTIKDAIDNYQRRLEYLKIEIELLEKKIKGIKIEIK